MILTVDFHAHILPGIDDGSPTPEESIEMIRLEQAAGVNKIILTPHFYPQQMFPSEFIEKRQEALDRLLSAIPADMNIPQLIPGAEVLFMPGMSQWEQLDSLTIANTKYIMIEMPFSKWNDSAFFELKLIHDKRGLKPIIAHIERYLPVCFTHSFLKRISELPVLLQSNCEFIADQRTRRTALKLVKAKKIQLIGTDCHSAGWRAPNIAEAREILLKNIDIRTLEFLKKQEDEFFR